MVRTVLILAIVLALVSPWLWQVAKSGRPEIKLRPVYVLLPEQITLLIIRRSAYPSPRLGRAWINKASLVGEAWLTNTFQLLDPNFYFFASHPRERGGGKEIARLPWWSLPFWLIGLWAAGRERRWRLPTWGWWLGGAILLGFLGLTDNWSALILLPPLVLTTALGVNHVWQKKN